MTASTNRSGGGLGHRLLQLGILLFLIGLLAGFAMPIYANTRMGLSSHLQGVTNGMFLIGLGLLWPRLRLGTGGQIATFALAIYGTFANWLATFLAAIWGAGSGLMPIASKDHTGSAAQEAGIKFLLLSLSFAMIAVCIIVLVGLRGGGRQDDDE